MLQGEGGGSGPSDVAGKMDKVEAELEEVKAKIELYESADEWVAELEAREVLTPAEKGKLRNLKRFLARPLDGQGNFLDGLQHEKNLLLEEKAALRRAATVDGDVAALEAKLQESELAREEAEKDIEPLLFPVALARVHTIKDCSSTATKPHVHDYNDPPKTTLVEDFGRADLQWRERGDNGRRLTSIFNGATQDGETLSTRNEGSLATYVGDILHDCVKALGLHSWVAINPEVTSLQIRADFWVIYDPDNRPIGTVEVKQHGALTDRHGARYASAVEHPGVLAQVRDQLSHLRHVWGVKQAFGIVTTLRAWRVCWLDDEDTNRLALADDEKVRERLWKHTHSTPEKARGASRGVSRASPPRTPVAAPAELKDVVVLGRRPLTAGEVDVGDAPPLAVPDASAALAMSKSIEVRKPATRDIKNKELADQRVMNLIGSALLRMCASELLFDLAEPFENVDKRNFTIVEPDRTYWGKLQLAEGCPAMDRFPRSSATRLWLVGRVGKGLDGIAHLACTAGARAVCVVKEPRARAGGSLPRAEDAKALLDKEQGHWQKVYGDDFPTRVAKWNGVWTLMTPFFSHVTRSLRSNDDVMNAIRAALDRFVQAKIRHDDIAWRNICLYRTPEGELRAVLIDLARVSKFPEGQDLTGWVEVALENLEASA
eukprot:TRINITY_DN81_c1_g1_i10.p1 TRINITY_DN81_c1_g1~~TRINITY_DN81_c1_g1_i10.p1  ORF type:complete len:688 (-),score=145.74 TRINITY_DN81_c1_g1_i10:282-2261(-)